MALSFMRWLRGTAGRAKVEEIDCRELFEAAEEYRIRELAFWVCVNLIANAVGRCEFRTYLGGREVREGSYYLWNVEPNVNQSSTAFLHKLIARLYQDNEALIIPTRKRSGEDALAVADSWQLEGGYPSRQNEYKGVAVGPVQYDKTFYEKDVIHLTLHHCDVGPVVRGVYSAYVKLISAAVKSYTWSNGQHWKVHVNQMASGQEGWEAAFQKQIDAQIRPFLNSDFAILPELDGWSYENVDKGFESGRDASHIRALVGDVFDFTANAFLIPPVLLRGQVEGVGDAQRRFLSQCVDPLMDQLSEEINRKYYGYEAWRAGSYMQIDTSAIEHFDLFGNAANIEKLIGSGYSYNDVQRAAGGREIDEDWANEHFITKNFADAQRALKGERPDGTENA